MKRTLTHYHKGLLHFFHTFFLAGKRNRKVLKKWNSEIKRDFIWRFFITFLIWRFFGKIKLPRNMSPSVFCGIKTNGQMSWWSDLNNKLEFIPSWVSCDIMKSPVWYPSCSQKKLYTCSIPTWTSKWQDYTDTRNEQHVWSARNTFSSSRRKTNHQFSTEVSKVERWTSVAWALSCKRTDCKWQQQATYMLILQWKYFLCGISQAIMKRGIAFRPAMDFPPWTHHSCIVGIAFDM